MKWPQELQRGHGRLGPGKKGKTPVESRGHKRQPVAEKPVPAAFAQMYGMHPKAVERQLARAAQLQNLKS